MKKLLYFISALALLVSANACQKEENTDTKGDLPKAEGITPVITVGDANVVTFSLPADVTGLVPIWHFQGEDGTFAYAGTGNGFQKQFGAIGEYTVRMFVSNSKGVSLDFVDAKFNIENEIQLVKLEGGYDYDAATNLWKHVDAKDAHTYSQYTAHTSSWEVIDNPAINQQGSSYNFKYEVSTDDQWQAQFFIIPTAGNEVNLEEGKSYDYSVCVYSTTAIPQVTFKFTEDGDDNNFLFVQRVDIPAETVTVVGWSNIPVEKEGGIPHAKMVFDFGGCPAESDITLGRITLQEHQEGALPEGVVAYEKPVTPEPEPEVPEVDYDIDGPGNLWKAATNEFVQKHFAPGWSENHDAMHVSVIDGGWKVVMDEATDSEWQAQVHIASTMTTTAAEKYDFCCTVKSNVDIPRMTVKLTDGNDASEIIYKNNYSFAAGEYVIRVVGAAGKDNADSRLIFDFGGCPAGTDVEITKICVQVSSYVAPSGPQADFRIDAETNLIRKANVVGDVEFYYAHGDGWAENANPIALAGNFVEGLTVTLPDESNLQWQAQVKITTDVTIDAAKLYDFCATVESNNAFNGITIKATASDSDGNFMFDPRFEVGANVPYVFQQAKVSFRETQTLKFVLDFGGCPAGTTVKFTDICLQEHIDPAK